MSPRAPASDDRLRVFITSWEVGEGAWTLQERKLKYLYTLSDKKYTLVDAPESADVILVGDVRAELPFRQFIRKALKHELIGKFPHKSFSLSHAARPLIAHHGIYTNGVKSILNLGRIRTGSYTLYNDEYLNPCVTGHRVPEPDSVRKEFLLVFIGRTYNTAANRARNAIFSLKFERSDVLIENSTSFQLWAAERDPVETLRRQKRYYDVLLRAKFSLCPRGGAANSIRLFESMQLGVAPVIVSDAWILPHGPKWTDFSIVLKERHIGEVEKVVQAHEPAYQEMGRLAREAFEKYFAEDVYFNYVVDNCVAMMHSQPIPEALCWRLSPMLLPIFGARRILERAAAKMAAAGVRIARAGTRRLSVS